jgi:hypothetical protein
MNAAQKKETRASQKKHLSPFCEKDRAQFTIISLIITLLNFQIHD